MTGWPAVRDMRCGVLGLWTVLRERVSGNGREPVDPRDPSHLDEIERAIPLIAHR